MTMTRRGRWTAAILGAAIAASLVLAPDTFAARRHVHLKKSAPAENETVTSPKAISLWFSEKVELAVTTVKIADAKGVAAQLGALKRAAADTAPVVIDVLQPMAPGKYTLAWSVAGKDGHPQKGSVKFTIKAAH